MTSRGSAAPHTASGRSLIVITGSSGVGKSTLARALQEQLLPEQWLHFSVDTLFYCLPRSLVARVDEHNDHAAVNAAAIVAGAHACARTLLSLGHKLIFDTVILSEKGALNLSRAFDECDPLLVELTCSWDGIRARTLARGDRTLAEAEHGFRNAHGHIRAHHSFDTSRRSAKDIATEVAMRARAAPIVGPPDQT